MIPRNPIVVAVLSLVTCGIYWFWWMYVTTNDLKRVAHREELNPVLDLVLNIATCAVWGLYVEYRNAKIIHERMAELGAPHEDKSTLILIMDLAAFMVGVTGYVAIWMLQEDLNTLAAALDRAAAA